MLIIIYIFILFFTIYFVSEYHYLLAINISIYLFLESFIYFHFLKFFIFYFDILLKSWWLPSHIWQYNGFVCVYLIRFLFIFVYVLFIASLQSFRSSSSWFRPCIMLQFLLKRINCQAKFTRQRPFFNSTSVHFIATSSSLYIVSDISIHECNSNLRNISKCWSVRHLFKPSEDLTNPSAACCLNTHIVKSQFCDLLNRLVLVAPHSSQKGRAAPTELMKDMQRKLQTEAKRAIKKCSTPKHVHGSELKNNRWSSWLHLSS